MITHRLSEELLLDFAAGSLPESAALVVAAHAALCAESAREIARLETLGGGLLSAIDGAPLRPGALDRALAALDSPAPVAPTAPSAPTPATRALLPAPVWPYVQGDVAKVAWHARGPHIATAHLPIAGGGGSAFLLRVKAGRAAPRHTHRGLELTLVLAGAFHDESEHFLRGDVQVADPTTEHRPIAEPGEDCLCLVALQAPIRFTGLIGRFANPFVRL
ncbi:MAG: ChrR family anti-sigma-E factor [Rhodospirillaceae bacterium]|nr:ChrR family anti-sigma-E factor [Rhodospirillaceae bacterium]